MATDTLESIDAELAAARAAYREASAGYLAHPRTVTLSEVLALSTKYDVALRRKAQFLSSMLEKLA